MNQIIQQGRTTNESGSAGERGRPAKETRSAGRPGGAGRGSSQAGMRLYNERLVLTLIRRHGRLPKAEIARLTGLSAQTGSVIVKRLEADGLLRPEKPRRGRIGQPSVPFSLDPAGAFSVGLKIGRRSADLVLMDFVGRVVARHRRAYRHPETTGLRAFVADGLKVLQQGLSPSARSRIAGLGVAMPGAMWDWQQEMGAPPGSLEPWRDFDVAAELASIVPWPVTVYNDATAACAAELVFGAGGRLRTFLYVFVGSFIGGGVVMDGRLLHGRTGNAGALGSMPVPAPAERAKSVPVPAGRAEPAVRGATRQLIQAASLFVLERRCTETGFDPALVQGDAAAWAAMGGVADAWVEEAARTIAVAAVSSTALIDLEAVVVDGSFPPDVRRRIVAAIRLAVAGMDLQGLSPFSVVEGTIGADARAIGGASLPLLAQFAVDSELLLKEG
ncbi:MAG: ROK family transcriptional regulator [Geminicoccaceae bacterium]|nr:ROK family transcriptional regulator [Geminicoccaceae bacterium]